MKKDVIWQGSVGYNPHEFEIVDQYSEGYRDGWNLEAPEPSENRSERYRHSFYIGRNEKLRLTNPSYYESMKRVAEIEEREGNR